MGLRVTKADIAKRISITKGFTQTAANEIADAIFHSMAIDLQVGNEIDIAGFGKFEVVTVAARTGRNPKTGETIEIPAKRAVKFKPAKALKDKVNG